MSFSGDVFEPMSNSNAKQRASLVEWLNSLLPNVGLPINSSDEELRSFLVDGTVLCQILNKLKPGSVTEHGASIQSESGSKNVNRFLSAVDKMGLPRFPLSDLEKGSMKIVLEWLLTLKTQFIPIAVGYSFSDTIESPFGSDASPKWKVLERSGSGGSVQKDESVRRNSSFQRASRSAGTAEPSAALIRHVGQKFHEVFQLKQGYYADLPAAKISEMMKSNSLDNAPTQSLLSVVNGILDESFERKNGEIPHVVETRVACLLRKVVQEIERRICTQAEHLRTQNNLFKAREEKYQSRIRVLEALATGTNEETQMIRNQLQQMQSEKKNFYEKNKVEEQDASRLRKEKDDQNHEISAVKQDHNHEISVLKQDHDREIAVLKQDHEHQMAALKQDHENASRLRKEKDDQNHEISAVKQDHNREISVLKHDHDREIAVLKQDHERQMADLKQDHERQMAALKEDHYREMAALKQDHDHEIAALRNQSCETAALRNHSHEIAALKEDQDQHSEIAALKDHSHEIAALKEDHDREMAALKQDHDREIAALRDHSLEIAALKEDHDREIAALKEDHDREMAALNQDHNHEIAALRDHSLEIAALKQDHDCEIAALKEDHDREMAALNQDHDREIAALRDHSREIAALKQDHDCEIAALKEDHDREMTALNQDHDLEIAALRDQNCEIRSLKQDHNHEVATLKQELETVEKNYEQQLLEMSTASRGVQQELEGRLKDTVILLTESKNKVKELEEFSELTTQRWNKKANLYQIFTEFQLGALRELKFVSQSVKQEITKTQKSYLEDFNHLGLKIKSLGHAATNYYSMLAENQKLHNELQELKGNIRVYCRIRPFLPAQKERQSTIEFVGENGDLVVSNPSKQGKESRRSFKFNKVYGQAAKQAEVFSDIQPLIQSVLDGYNVCIFAYGQTGSGKTYTMTGPDRASEEDWGVNYRALNNLFRISQSREGAYSYEVSVQMVEIYNEQVRDLLSSDGAQKRLGILSTIQPNGLAVPDATMYPVKETSDVLQLMDLGLKNRAKSSTALNERSSRSHSIVTIHIRAVDHKTSSAIHSSLHLVDLAGSERVDRSEVTGDRLKEAQHINKSLSALGDVISALAQKSTHIPYRNSKLTQVLQSSLGGQAKTLMFVQLNPDASSYSETMSTLKFAERVSGIELGAARSNKDGRDVRELMEQVASLKDTIAKKDEEIERLQVQKDIKNGYQGVNNEKNSTNSLRN